MASNLPKPPSPEFQGMLVGYVQQAFALLRQSKDWSAGKKFEHGVVQARSTSSGMEGRLGKLGWHMRESSHPVSRDGLNYDDFKKGLMMNHVTNEKEYIDGLKDVKLVEALQPGTAEIWLNSYKLPIITSDRDFLELILSIELPAHAEPFSESHEQAVLAALSSSTPSVTVDDPVTDAGAGATQKRSFLVISLPTSHTDAPERKGSYVRGMYASIEAVNESVSGGEDAVDWRMATQSDAAGMIPITLSERAMPGKIAEDVPSFLNWAKARKA